MRREPGFASLIGILIALFFVVALVMMYSRSMVGSVKVGGPQGTLEGVRERVKEIEAGQAKRLEQLEGE